MTSAALTKFLFDGVGMRPGSCYTRHSERLTPWTSKTEQQVKARGRDPLNTEQLQQLSWWVLDAAGSWMDSLFVSHQPLLSFPFSFLPPSSSSSSLCSSTNRATPALLPTSPLSSSSLLHVYTLKGSTEPTGPTPNTNTLVLTLPELLPQLPAKLNSSSFFFLVFLVFDTKHLSFCLFLSLLAAASSPLHAR